MQDFLARSGWSFCWPEVALAIADRSGDSDKALFETAQLEELQNNYDHATTLYREIIEKHLKSDYATKARERLNGLKRVGH